MFTQSLHDEYLGAITSKPENVPDGFTICSVADHYGMLVECFICLLHKTYCCVHAAFLMLTMCCSLGCVHLGHFITTQGASDVNRLTAERACIADGLTIELDKWEEATICKGGKAVGLVKDRFRYQVIVKIDGHGEQYWVRQQRNGKMDQKEKEKPAPSDMLLTKNPRFDCCKDLQGPRVPSFEVVCSFFCTTTHKTCSPRENNMGFHQHVRPDSTLRTTCRWCTTVAKCTRCA